VLATYIANHYAEDGIMAFSLNPGGIKSELQRHSVTWYSRLLSWLILFPTPFGAITQLYAGTSPELTMKDTGKYFIPWAREVKPSRGVQDPALADKLWAFLEKDTQGKY
jgi:retinol dehydrogenase 12